MRGESCPLSPVGRSVSVGAKCHFLVFVFVTIRHLESRMTKGKQQLQDSSQPRGSHTFPSCHPNTAHSCPHVPAAMPRLGAHFWERWTPCDCKLPGTILPPLQWCWAPLHPFSHSLPAGNQIASLTTNDLERRIFWCHLVLSFLAFILMWLVAQEPPVCAWQIMGCMILEEEKRTRDRRKKKKKSLVWFENPYARRKKIASIIKMMFFTSPGSGRAGRQQGFLTGTILHF